MKKLLILSAIIFLMGCDKGGTADKMAISPATGTGGSLARFTIAGNFLYTVDKQNLKVFEISYPSNPQYIRTVPIGFEIETIFPFGDKLFIGSTSMVHIFSISDPSNPQKLGEAISPDVMRRCDPVVAKDTVAYATLRTNGPCGGTQSVLAVYDIHDVTHPVQKATVPVGEPYGLGYSGNTLYVCDRNALLVYDISQAFHPVQVKQLPSSAYNFIDVVPFDNLLICWVSNGMLVYDISNKQNPVLLTQIN